MADYIKETSEKAERRFCSTGIEMRAKDGGPTVFRGYAAKFNTLSNDFGGWKERIAPGFFDSVLANDVRALRDHEPGLILGRTAAGTCRIGVDSVGLWFEYDDPGTSYSRDLAISIGRGDVNQCSFAFTLPMEGGDMFEQQSDGSYLRTLLKCDQLYDVSPVTYPAYEDTVVAARTFKKIQIPDGIEAAKDLIDMDHRMMKLKI
ncbi:MAG TPA: HK97 family phage prohead protease [Cyclobacteriaceae bacterium]|nr:HK97 family phage prohead protease [Cyclobacteriaceae bacterium]